jgi:hypothetical protein
VFGTNFDKYRALTPPLCLSPTGREDLNLEYAVKLRGKPDKIPSPFGGNGVKLSRDSIEGERLVFMLWSNGFRFPLPGGEET